MTILEEINNVKKDEVKNLRKQFTISSFSDFENFNIKCLEFGKAISNKSNISIIAEIKKASPSKGIIREDFNHLNIAETYMEYGANAISVLTDVTFFKGSIKYLNDISRYKTVPLLRKDFIIDEYQIYEAKANGADAILLIAESLSAKQINELTHAANEIGLEVLLELHSLSQIEKINFDLNKIIGINNRNLEDFSVSLETTKSLSEKIHDDIILVSESGIHEKQDIEFLKDTKTNAVLVGEHLMKHKDIKSKLFELKEWCEVES